MNTNSVLKKEGIEIITKLETSQTEKIANIVATKICQAFPEHNLNTQNLLSSLINLDMYFAKMPDNSAVAKYHSHNNAIYFNQQVDLENLDTLVIHECLHALH